MLSNITFDEFYKEEYLPNVTDKKLALLALLILGKGLGSKQIHKLLFLSFVEGMILLPFKFLKKQNGQFSEDARDVLTQLEDEEIIENIPEKIYDFNKHRRILTNKGIIFVQDNSNEINKIKDKIAKTIADYEEDGQIETANALERYCYKNFYLNPRDKSDEEWKLFIKNKISDLMSLLSDRTTHIKGLDELEEDKTELILASFDYVENLLRKLLISEEMDQVVKGVLIKKIEDYINKWGEILRLADSASSDEEIKKLLLESRLIFKFINEVSLRYEIFESVYGRQKESDC